MPVWGGRTGQRAFEFFRAKIVKAEKSRSDAMTIAQPFMAGYRVNQMEKSREGRQKNSFVPGRDFGKLPATSPSHKWLGYFQVKRRDAGNGHRDGRAPQQCPSRAANGSLGWMNGAMGG
jgi:hypothetical protein